MKYIITKENYQFLPNLAFGLKKQKIQDLEIEMAKESEDMPEYAQVMEHIYPVLDNELYYNIWLINFPFCAAGQVAFDHVLKKDDGQPRIKKEECLKCLWHNACPGFSKKYLEKYPDQEICVEPDKPVEVMIEAEPKCNFNCQFCFNKLSFAKQSRKIKSLSNYQLKKVINQIADFGVKIVRFTGGEPLLRKDLINLLAYAKSKGLEVRLNTNGSLLNKKNIKEISQYVDNVLIPLESWQADLEDKLTGLKGSFDRKIRAIGLLKNNNVKVVRIGTVASRQVINNFEKMFKIISGLNNDEWELYRPISIGPEILSELLINKLADSIIDCRLKTNKQVFIANALPFCSIKNSKKLNAVTKGALYDDGHWRLVIDPRGFIKPHYYIDEKLANSYNIKEAWRSTYARNIRELINLSQECKKCNYVLKCRGGSNFACKYNKLGKDPLVKYN